MIPVPLVPYLWGRSAVISVPAVPYTRGGRL